jgi:uncharacterized membrane protein
MEKTMSNNKEPTRWNIVMTGLLYPAILGALIYEGLAASLSWVQKVIAVGFLQAISATGFLIVALFVLYTFDYLYTCIDKAEYDGSNFFCDLTIIALLYLTIKIGFQPNQNEANKPLQELPAILYTPALLLFFTKVVSVLWEYIDRKKDKEPHKDFDISTDFMAGIIYFLICLLTIMTSHIYSAISTWLVFIAVCMDIRWYYKDIVIRKAEENHRIV